MPRNILEDDPQRVHAAWSQFEAQLVKEALFSEGIDAWLKNERLVGSIGLLPVGDAMVEVWVERKDAEQAEALVKHVLYNEQSALQNEAFATNLESAESLSPAVKTCPSCNAPWEPGFNKCWKCCATLPER